MKKLLLSILFGLTTLSPSFAQSNCGKYEDAVKLLQESYGETRQTVGLASNGAMVEMFASVETGTWTILVTIPGGPTCLAAEGSSYQLLVEPPGQVH